MRYTRKENEEWQGKNKGRSKYVSILSYQEGVFENPDGNGKWLVKVFKTKNKRRPSTISQHNTKEEAERAYEAYYS